MVGLNRLRDQTELGVDVGLHGFQFSALVGIVRGQTAKMVKVAGDISRPPSDSPCSSESSPVSTKARPELLAWKTSESEVFQHGLHFMGMRHQDFAGGEFLRGAIEEHTAADQ